MSWECGEVKDKSFLDDAVLRDATELRWQLIDSLTSCRRWQIEAQLSVLLRVSGYIDATELKDINSPNIHHLIVSGLAENCPVDKTGVPVTEWFRALQTDYPLLLTVLSHGSEGCFIDGANVSPRNASTVSR